MTRARSPLAAARSAVLAAAIPAILEHGWNRAALDAAVAATGIDAPLAARAFPSGARSLLEEFHRSWDASLPAALATHDAATLRTGQRIGLAVRLRIEAMGERAFVRRAIAFQALPENVPAATRSLARTVDAIWRAVGDRSLDFSYYTKRATLAAIYAATVLYWLQDDSADSAETWAFLNRRLRGVAAFGAARKRTEEFVAGAFGSAATVAKGLGALAKLGPSALPGRSTVWSGIRSARSRLSGR